MQPAELFSAGFFSFKVSSLHATSSFLRARRVSALNPFFFFSCERCVNLFLLIFFFLEGL
jgi:hypothetical protein